MDGCSIDFLSRIGDTYNMNTREELIARRIQIRQLEIVQSYERQNQEIKAEQRKIQDEIDRLFEQEES